MKTLKKITKQLCLSVLVGLALMSAPNYSSAQTPSRNVGFGLILGDPLGGTIKIWTSSSTAFVADIGTSYFGVPRVELDYDYHFNAFNSNVVTMYAGPGLALGFGPGNVIFYRQGGDRFYYRTGNELAVGVRGMLGINIIPRDTPLEFFFELGPLIGISPAFGGALDAALGIRIYP